MDFSQWEKKIYGYGLVDKDEYIVSLSHNAKVLHIGATDYPFSLEKAQHNGLLHQKLMRVTENILGIDCSRQSIETLKKFGINNIILGDATNMSQYLPSNYYSPDIIVCGDIIEHVENVGNLLEGITKIMSFNTQLVLTTINACAAKVFFRALMGREAVHPDHVAYYSLSTLGSLVSKFGLSIVECKWFYYGEKNILSRSFFQLLRAVAPQTSDGILIVCKKTQLPN